MTLAGKTVGQTVAQDTREEERDTHTHTHSERGRGAVFVSDEDLSRWEAKVRPAIVDAAPRCALECFCRAHYGICSPLRGKHQLLLPRGKFISCLVIILHFSYIYVSLAMASCSTSIAWTFLFLLSSEMVPHGMFPGWPNCGYLCQVVVAMHYWQLCGVSIEYAWSVLFLT